MITNHWTNRRFCRHDTLLFYWNRCIRNIGIIRCINILKWNKLLSNIIIDFKHTVFAVVVEISSVDEDDVSFESFLTDNGPAV